MSRWIDAVLPAFILSAMLMWPPASASATYQGCPGGPAARNGHAFYVDPLRGSRGGDGSRQHPWRTLAEVVEDGLISTAPKGRARASTALERAGAAVQRATQGFMPGSAGPIGPGDTVYLLSGDHGAVLLQGYFGKGMVGYANPDFITIAALPGQTPVLRRLAVLGGEKWIFRGLTIRGINETGSSVFGGSANKDYWLVSFRGPTENIIFDNNEVLSANDVSHWSMKDWASKRASGVEDRDGQCIAITGNRIHNIGVGIQTQRSDRVLIENNMIDYFSDDGVDYGSSDLLIDNNRISNSIEDGDELHRDGMQGQPYNADAVVRNVKITKNTIIRMLDANLPFPGYLQGIDTFDGVWENLEVSDNTVVTDAWQGIAYYGVHGAEIRDNILLRDNGKLAPCLDAKGPSCDQRPIIYDQSNIPGIVISPGKDGRPSTDVRITRNITTSIRIDKRNPNISVSRNLCLLTEGKCIFGVPSNGSLVWGAKPGVYGDHNEISDLDPPRFFTKFDSKALKYDLRPRRRNITTRD